MCGHPSHECRRACDDEVEEEVKREVQLAGNFCCWIEGYNITVLIPLICFSFFFSDLDGCKSHVRIDRFLLSVHIAFNNQSTNRSVNQSINESINNHPNIHNGTLTRYFATYLAWRERKKNEGKKEREGCNIISLSYNCD